MITVKMKKAANNTEVLTLPETVKIRGVSITSSVSQVNRNILNIEATNNTDTTVHLEKGTNICTGECFDTPIKTVQTDNRSKDPVFMIGIGDEERKKLYSEAIKKTDYHDHIEELQELIWKYRDVVAVPGDKMGCTNVLKHHINLEPGTKPIYIPAYRLPEKHRKPVREAVEEMIEEGIVRPSSSPYNFPLLCVPKKDGTWRVVVDFRKLNLKTVPD